MAAPLIKPPTRRRAKTMMKRKELIRDYLPLDIISKNVSFCKRLIEGPEQKTMFFWEQLGGP